MESRVPWWRRVIDFALGGFRTGFGLFARNGKVEAGVAADTATAAEEFESSAGVGPEVVSGAESTEEERVEMSAQAGTGAEPVAGDGAVKGEFGPELETASSESEEAESEEPEEEIALTNTSPHFEAIAAEAKQAVEAGEASDEKTAAQAAAKAPSTQEPSAATTGHQEVPAGEAAETPSTQETARTEGDVAAAASQSASPAELPFALPSAGELRVEEKPERTTAEKVAAALKARGEDAEQSPFSVIVGQVYDGPLDLLLDLIRKQDIDIYDIPIAKITAQFLAYVDRLKAGDMDVAGEFIYTAALLIHIKSKMLLPRAPVGPEEPVEDPRRELVERLLEHERFKNAAQMLHEKQMLEAATWTNPGVREFREDASGEEIAPEIAADTTDLVRVFRDILERARSRPILNLEEDSVTVSQMIQFLTRRLTMEDKPVALRRLLSHTRSERALIAMFLALLELVRMQAILLRQDRQFSEIFVKKNTGFEVAMNQGLADARDDWR